MQQYSDTSSGTFAINTSSNRELSKKLHIGTRALSSVFQRLEDRGILTTKPLTTRDSITGLNKTAKYIDLSIICQAILFINKKVDEQGEQINEHDKRLHTVDKNILKMQEEINRLKEIIEKSNLKSHQALNLNKNMDQQKNLPFSFNPISLEGIGDDYSIIIDTGRDHLDRFKTREEERLDELYDRVEKLEYRIVELENRLRNR